MADKMNAEAKGAGWDKMYIDNEVGKSISIIDVVTLTVIE